MGGRGTAMGGRPAVDDAAAGHRPRAGRVEQTAKPAIQHLSRAGGAAATAVLRAGRRRIGHRMTTGFYFRPGATPVDWESPRSIVLANPEWIRRCLLYTSDAADDLLCV